MTRLPLFFLVSQIMLASESKIVKNLQGRAPAAFILGDSGGHALGYARSLGRKGITTVILDTARGIGARSRYCYAPRGDIAADESKLLAFLERVGKKLPGAIPANCWPERVEKTSRR